MLIVAGCGRERPLRDDGSSGRGGIGGSGGSGGSGGASGSGGGGSGEAGAGGSAAGMGGSAGRGGATAGTGGATAGTGGATAGTGGATAGTGGGGGTAYTCPTTIDGVLEATDQSQIGRVTRIAPVNKCGMTKPFPGNQADATEPHFVDVHHFVNPTSAADCFTFTLTYDTGGGIQRYLGAYSSFDPANIGNGYLGDMGDVLTSPQTFSITVAAGSAIDVVVSAITAAPTGAGSYSLKCETSRDGGP